MTIALRNEAATDVLGATIAKGLKPGDAVLLKGELGSGKTTLARAILRALGIREYIPSPSFTLMQSYATPQLTVHHFDLYRVAAPSELRELGISEALGEGAILVEWPERAGKDVEADALEVELSITNNNERQATLRGSPRWIQMFEGTHK